MSRRLFSLAVVLAFAVALGHLTYQALLSRTVASDYVVGGQMTALSGTDPADKHLYLRRRLFLAHQPRHAWLQVQGRDQLRVYVNEKMLGEEDLLGCPVGVLANITPYLRIGHNVIAIDAKQYSLRQPPVVAVDGAYVLDDGEHPIRTDDAWRCQSFFERKGLWWFQIDFDDRHWPIAPTAPCELRYKETHVPRSITEPNLASWITPATLGQNASVRQEFTVANRPQQAWLRVTTTSAYCLAVNGMLVDQHEGQVDASTRAPPVQRIYDISKLVKRGNNAIAFALTSTVGPPHLLADAEVEDGAKHRVRLGTDETWMSHADSPPDWLKIRLDSTEGWGKCAVDTGDMGIPPWQIRREFVSVATPTSLVVRQVAQEIAVIVMIFLLTLLACRFARRGLAFLGNWPEGLAPAYTVFVPLVPVTLAIAAAVLVTYDPRIACQDVYRGSWVFWAVVAVIVQWLLLAWAAGMRESAAAPAPTAAPSRAVPVRRVALAGIVLVGIIAASIWLRLRDLTYEPMHWDEVDVYNATQGMLAKGFAGHQLKDCPRAYSSTSELVFYYTGFANLITKRDVYVCRAPSVCWSIVTTILMFMVGRRFFNTQVGLVAAALHACSPVCIAMCDFGRYFAQLQFFTLLTTYFFWLTIKGTGPLNRWYLWLTAICFLGVYLTWEGGALMAPGMIVVAFLHRRGRLWTIFGDPAVWGSLFFALLVILLQLFNRALDQTQFIWYGISLSDTSLKPMWRYPNWEAFYFMWESSWNRDAFLPFVGIVGGAILSIRHAYRESIRCVLIVYVANAVLLAALLPNETYRYIHQLIPFVILLFSVTLVVTAHRVAKLARELDVPVFWRNYGRGVQVATIVALIALGSGLLVELRDMSSFRVQDYSVTTFKFPNMQGPVLYVRDHMQEGDLVLTSESHQVNHLMQFHGKPGWWADYWPAMSLELPAEIDNVRDVPFNRKDGTTLLSSYEALDEIFARHRRIWFIIQPGAEAHNGPLIDKFFRENMDVVYEDWQSLVLFRGEAHRPANVRQRDEKELFAAGANYLP
jgi:hypothetical protein